MGALIAKLIYTAILVGLIAMLSRELWKVWLDPQIYIGRFEVMSDTGKDEDASIAFSKRIVSAQAMLVRQMSEYQTRNVTAASSDQTYALPGSLPLSLPPEALEGIEITIQNVNIRQILTTIRRAFLAPNEISGHVTIRSGSVLAAIDWPNAPTPTGERLPLSQFLIPSQPSLQESAAYIACLLSWARAVGVDSKFAAIPRQQFCDFSTALNDLFALRDKSSTVSGLDKEQTALVRRRAMQLKNHYGAGSIYPELYRLRADLLELLPEDARTNGELVDVQEDRVQYAMLSKDLRNLPPDEKRMAALALARPALIIEGGKVTEPPDNWAGLLRRHETDSMAVSASTGVFRGNKDSRSGTGFIVAPGLVMTAAYVIDYAGGETSIERGDLMFCPGDGNTDQCMKVGKTVYTGEIGLRKIIIAEISNHDPVLAPPVSFWQPLPTANELTGRYVYVMGFPYPDLRLPIEFMNRLLGGVGGRKRLMPGRILAVGQKGPSGEFEGALEEAPLITTDISTSGGSAGGPLVDLATGKVIALSYYGVWKGERGKFAYAQSIPKEALDVINKRLLGQFDSNDRFGPQNPASP
ncbi:Trypsin-like peptidase domain-containing protein [Methylobacterium sp. 174MFSha1.1]|uniref:S1 family peptidase n=1 Tax=Methylobacterium sp. 174MFSha1.1 TaxID=1502749 RepID=UPI0008F33842|nr:serine protease [Methylobacterium sp. 174MFSha1.1]SFV08090.1 Trypsin-like peptidase domain-containing protein [Methylobacterium sp. 174MFSha1.1]